MGIGRPSTYSSMVSIVQDRNYVERKDIPGEKKKVKRYSFKLDSCELDEKTDEISVNGEKGKLVPTDIGKIVNEYLEKNIGDIVNYEFTVNLEKMLDDIANGTQDWTGVVQCIYDTFNPQFDKLISTSELEKEKYKRKLGIDPYTGREIITYIAKYGPYGLFKSTNSSQAENSKRKSKNKSLIEKDKYVS